MAQPLIIGQEEFKRAPTPLAQPPVTSQEKSKKSKLETPLAEIVEHIDPKMPEILIQKVLELLMLKKKLQKSLKGWKLKKPKIY